MTKQVQRRRGTATQHTSFTGAEGELSVNTTNKSVHVHDNVTAGGFEAARADMDNVTSSSILTAAGITATTTELNYVDGVTSAIQTQIDGKAGTASPTFTGTLTTANLTATGTTTLAGASTSADITFGDNDKAIFGAGSDLQIYHDGASYITENGQGSLFIEGTNLFLRDSAGNNYIEMDDLGTGGQVKLYHNAQEKLATTSTGIDVTGTITADGLTVDGTGTFNNNVGVVVSGATPTIRITETDTTDENTQFIQAGGTFRIRTASDDYSTTTERLRIDHGTGDISFYEDTGTTAKLTWDASAEMLTTSGLTVDGDAHFGNNDAILFDNFAGTQTLGIKADTSNRLNFRTGDTDNRMTIAGNGDISFYEDTGTTAKLHWSAADERLGIGTTSPSSALDLAGEINFSGLTASFPSPSQPRLYRSGSSAGSYPFDNFGHLVIQARGDGSNRDIVFATGTAGANKTVITSSGSVGIGNASPSSYNTGSRTLVIGDGGTEGISIHAGTGMLHFTNGADTTERVSIKSTVASNTLEFTTGGSEAMRLDASGNLLVGQTVGNVYNQSSVTGLKFDGANGNIQTARANNVSLLLNRYGTDGEIINFYKDGAPVGSIGTSGGRVYFADDATNGITFSSSSAIMWPSNSSGGVVDNTMDIGSSSYRFKDLYLSSNLKVGGTNSFQFQKSGTNGYINMADTGALIIRNGTGFEERMRLDSSGNLLLGTTSLNTGTLGTGNTFLEIAGDSGGSGTLTISRPSNTNAEEVGGIRFANANNADDDGLDADGKIIAGISARTVTSDSNAGDDAGGNLVFYTKPEAGNYAERMRIDSSGNVGIGVVPESWYTGGSMRALQVGGNTGVMSLFGTRAIFASNYYLKSGTGADTYINTDEATQYYQEAGTHVWKYAPSGTADTTISWSEAMRIDSSGNLLVGTTDTAPAVSSSETGLAVGASGYVATSRSGNPSGFFNRLSSDGDIVQFNKNGSTVGSIGFVSTGAYIQGETDHSGFRFGGGQIIPFRNGADTDNTTDLGASGFRFDDIFATNATIQTSDQNEKQQIASLTTAEIAAAKAISQLFKTFKWNSSVTANGDAARTHTGVIAQEVETAMTNAGLDAGDYAFFISDTWTNEDGTSQTRKGIRYPELLSFVGAATEQRLADIETRLTALEGV